MLNAFWYILWGSDEQETKVSESCSLNVIVDIRDSAMEKLLNSDIVRSSGVSATNGIHSSIPNNSILRSDHLLNESISLLFLTEDLEGKGDGKSSDDLLVILVFDMV